jgi:hypothetical protein
MEADVNPSKIRSEDRPPLNCVPPNCVPPAITIQEADAAKLWPTEDVRTSTTRDAGGNIGFGSLGVAEKIGMR